MKEKKKRYPFWKQVPFLTLHTDEDVRVAPAEQWRLRDQRAAQGHRELRRRRVRLGARNYAPAHGVRKESLRLGQGRCEGSEKEGFVRKPSPCAGVLFYTCGRLHVHLRPRRRPRFMPRSPHQPAQQGLKSRGTHVFGMQVRDHVMCVYRSAA